ADPWLVQMIGGLYQINAAWEARGKGWASEVTDAGWKGFHEHLTAARECLTAAYKLHPEFPEAATHMITVAMGDSEKDETPRKWFDLATAAQIDYLPAYRKLRWSLRP